jgi:serine/threonine protein kinase
MRKIFGNVEYEIIQNIADGGMGSVFKALEKGVEGFEKIVAIKTLLSCYSDDKKFVDRFIAEAKLVANLVHENIVQTYMLNQYNGEYYFVLEFVDGISLYDFMEFHRKTQTVLPRNLAVFIAGRIARGLAYAHSRCDNFGRPLNIVHCDVCPHNVLINTEGLPKITDFGIAKATTMNDEDGTISGKLPFMSPEQANKQEIDFRSDIYSLGIVLFYLLSGETTRRIDVTLNEILQQAKTNFIDWIKLPDDVDSDLMSILERMLATNPSDRYQNTSELARDLEYYIYKDGYGPTIVTLANYMRTQLPALFEIEQFEPTCDIGKTVVITDVIDDKTVRLPGDFLKH